MNNYTVTRETPFKFPSSGGNASYKVILEESDTATSYHFRLVVFGEPGPWDHFEKAPYIYCGHMALSPYFTESGEWEVYRIEKAI